MIVWLFSLVISHLVAARIRNDCQTRGPRPVQRTKPDETPKTVGDFFQLKPVFVVVVPIFISAFPLLSHPLVMPNCVCALCMCAAGKRGSFKAGMMNAGLLPDAMIAGIP